MYALVFYQELLFNPPMYIVVSICDWSSSMVCVLKRNVIIQEDENS